MAPASNILAPRGPPALSAGAASPRFDCPKLDFLSVLQQIQAEVAGVAAAQLEFQKILVKQDHARELQELRQEQARQAQEQARQAKLHQEYARLQQVQAKQWDAIQAEQVRLHQEQVQLHEAQTQLRREQAERRAANTALAEAIRETGKAVSTAGPLRTESPKRLLERVESIPGSRSEHEDQADICSAVATDASSLIAEQVARVRNLISGSDTAFGDALCRVESRVDELARCPTPTSPLLLEMPREPLASVSFSPATRDADRCTSPEPLEPGALLVAVWRKDTARCLQILSRSDFVEVNAKDSCGRTALIVAATLGLPEVCFSILSRADFVEVSAQDDWGRTAVGCAEYRGLKEVVQEIQAKVGR